VSAREDILARVRAGRATPGREDTAPFDTSGVLPIGAVRTAPSLTELFLAKLKHCHATHARIGTLGELPAHVAALLREQGLPLSLVLAPEPALAGLGWRDASLAVTSDLAPTKPGTVVSCAAFAVAETGSIVLTTAGPSRPAHNLLAELHIVAIAESQIVATPEDAWRAVTKSGIARGVVFVTGPSRTGDIEMTLELGAHGAVGLHVVLVERGIVNA